MIWSIPLHPVFDFLRDDPRYLEWEAKLPWHHAAPMTVDAAD
jgi:hypothetical protein